MRGRSLVRCGMVSLSLVGLSAPIQAQSLADRVSSARDGAVTFHFTPRPGVCGDGEQFIRTGRHSYHGSFTVNRPREACVVGPLQVRLTVRDGAVERVESWAGPLRSRNASDLGVVPAAEAARYLMTIAQRGAPSASAKAIFPAVLADSARVWPALLAIARDVGTRSKTTRQEALFWLSRFASGAIAGRPDQPFDMEDDEKDADDDLKVHAVFVLSQLPNGAGIPTLLDAARSNPSLRVRSQAFFWLGQSGDPRAIELFESVLRQ